jgi:hypothetical protein
MRPPPKPNSRSTWADEILGTGTAAVATSSVHPYFLSQAEDGGDWERSAWALLLFLTFWRARPATGRQPTDSDPSHDELDMAGRRALRDRR